MSATLSVRARAIVGWLAVLVSTALTCLWAFWGIIENFYEGWYYTSLLQNLELMVAQYLMVMLAFLVMSLAAVRWPRPGAVLHGAVGLYALYFFRGASLKVLLPLVTLPLSVLGAMYWLGRPEPRRPAVRLLVTLPLLTLIAAGARPAWIVAHRTDDGNRGARVVDVGGIRLVWAPAGPGWPDTGVTWHEAVRRCRQLNADGFSVAEMSQGIWRLPTVEEAVTSQALHGNPSGGIWDPAHKVAVYQITPDKEPPLWNPHSPVIYLWTATSANDRDAYRIVYNGQVIPTFKEVRWGYLGFRCVREAPAR